VKIIDAFWEERNLGKKVCEMIFDQEEVLESNLINDLEKTFDYIVAKVPAESVYMVHVLENLGFRYLENQQTIYFSSNQFLKVDTLWEKRFQNFRCEKVSEIETLKDICDKIKSGLYLNGRISADPSIENGISDLRIVNWLKDLYPKEHISVYTILKEDKSIGYFVLDRINTFHLNIVQAGIFRDFQNQGYSFLLLFNILKISFEDKVKGIFASVSSANIKTINSISKFVHFSVKDTYVVLRKNVFRTKSFPANSPNVI
jgi:hypothetical protein